jgi:uncharacterized protein involved in exopolysaccharide biosynthesis
MPAQSRRDNLPSRDQAALIAYQQASMLPAQQDPGAEPENAPNVLKGILRHWWLVVLFAVIGAAAAWIYLRQTQPLFTSYAKIYIEPAGTAPVASADALGIQQRGSFLYTQSEVIRSSPNLSQAIKQLQNFRTFASYGGNGLWFLREQLNVEVGRRDEIITVSIDSPYPDEAAKIVDAVVQSYIDSYTAVPEIKATGLLGTLQQKKQEAEAEVQSIEDKMFQFRRANPKLAIATVVDQHFAMIAQAYNKAVIDLINAQANYPAAHPMVQKAQAAEQALRKEYDSSIEELMRLNSKGAEYERMKADLTQAQNFSKQLEDRIRQLELAQRQAPQINRIEQLEPATVPAQPSYPRKNRTMAVALAAGMLLGAGLALLRDRMDGRMRSVEEIQTVIGLPILGVVPQMSGRRTAVARAMTVHLDP